MSTGVVLKICRAEARRYEMTINSKSLQLKLSKNIKSLAKPNATKDIVDEIKKLLKETVS